MFTFIPKRFPIAPLRNLWRQQDGGFLGSAIVIGIIVAVVAVLFLDGIASLKAYQNAGDVTEGAAREAVSAYKLTRNIPSVEEAAIDYCEEKGLDFISFESIKEAGRSFEVTCAASTDTIVFKHFPYLKDLTYQQQTIRSESVY